MEVLNQQTIKGYQLKECLGEGAYGVVYRAFQPQVGREVAIKIILPEFANHPEFIRRFETEAQLVAQLEHINIVPLYDYWREPDGAYLVMRLMKGGSLADSLRECGRWEPAETVRLVDQVAAALGAAHQQGVVHRDLKPANILLDENGNAYLSDFGIAKELSKEVGLTQTGAIVGTPAYITPEQVQSQAVTPQTDIYALGIVLYELLTGEHPFAQTPTGAMIVKQVNEPLPLARKKRPELPTEVDAVIQKATAKDPATRYPDALTLAAKIRHALQLEIVLPTVPEGEITNPYKGLRAFQEADAGDFFGREALTEQLLNSLDSTHSPFEGEDRFLAVVGPSGSGKSSVVKAGLLPALRDGALPGSECWFITEMVPGTYPLEEVELSLLRIAVKEPPSLMEQLEKDERGLLRAARRVLPEGAKLLLVVDQLEEVFTLVDDPTISAFFLQSLYEAVVDPRSPLRVVVTLRADFYDRPLKHPDFSRLMQKRTEVVVPLTSEELERAIRAPAERVGVLFEKGLISVITADVIDQPGALPLLQYALTELFERRQGRMLTSKVYQSIGGVLGALGRRAEEVYSSLVEHRKEPARQLFLRLVALGEGTEDTRRRALRSELESLFRDQQPEMGKIIDHFGRARLLTFDRDMLTRGATVEVAHEALLREWRRLREWLDESQADVRMQRLLRNAAAEWILANREPSFLLRGTRLDQFAGWYADTDLALTQVEAEYLEHSMAERNARQAAETERRQRELKQISVGLASQALQEIEGSFPERSVLLALEALEQYPYTWQAERALGQAVLDNRLRQGLRHDDTVNTVEWSLDGNKILSSSEDRTLKIWDSLSGEELVRITDGAPTHASWSPDERFILAINVEDLVVKVWDTETWAALTTLQEENIEGRLDIYIRSWQPWSPSGDLFLIYTTEGQIIIWDPQANEAVHTLSGHQGGINQAYWSPDGELILSAGWDDGKAIIWNARDGEVVYAVSGDFEDVLVAVGNWSPSGDRFTIRGWGGTKIFDTNTGQQILDISTPQVHCFRVIWSPDGTRLLTTGIEDGSARIWDAYSGQELHAMTGLVQGRGSDWSPAEDLAAVGGHDSYVHLWDVVSGREVNKFSGTLEAPYHIAFSPNGERLLTLGASHTVNVYDLSEAYVNIPMKTYGGISIPSWSPDGEKIAFDVGFTSNYSLKVWDTSNGQELIDHLYNQIDKPGTFSWSPSGDLFFTSDIKTDSIHIWDTATWVLLQSFTSPDKPSGHWGVAAWSPNGKQIAINNPDPHVVIWDVITGERNIIYEGHEGQVYCVAWSPDGELILSNGTKGEAMIWEAATGQLLFNLFPEDYNRVIAHGAWTKDSRRVVVLSEDGSVTIFDAKTGEQQSQFSTTKTTSFIIPFSLSPTDERIIIGSHDNVARVWDLATGTQLLGYQVGGASFPSYSPGGNRVALGITSGNEGGLQIFPTWHSDEELITYARKHCVFRELTADERQLFGLPERARTDSPYIPLKRLNGTSP